MNFSKIILKCDQWFRRRCHLKQLLTTYAPFSMFSSGGHLAQWSITKIVIFKEGNKMNISVKLF